MSTTPRHALVVAALVLAGGAFSLAASGRPVSAAAQDVYGRAALADFQTSVSSYLDLRWKAARAVPGLKSGSRAARQRAIEAHALAVQIAREDVRRGNVFTASVSVLFRHRINEAIDVHGASAADVIKELNAGRAMKVAPPRVNERFAWLRVTPMPAWLLSALPELPAELQYRVFDRDLVLFDYSLAIVVDVLPAVIPDVP